MIQNYFKIAIRSLLKFKGYAAINIIGLAIGLACCMLIVQYLRNELNHDTHHAKLEQLYRVGSTFITGDRETKTATGPSPLAWTLVQDFPEVEAAARVLEAPGVSQYLVKYENQSFFETDGLLADSTFFRLLTYNFIEGEGTTALNEPYNVVISIEMARKIFGDEKAVGKTLKIGDQWGEEEYQVTGVIDQKDQPSHIKGNFFMNMRSGEVGRYFYALNEWAGNNLFYTYIKLAPSANAETLAAKFPALVEQKAGERLRTLGFEKAHHLEAVKDIYLYSDAQYAIGPLGDISLVYIFGIIAAFILLIASINFMNLSTAKATIRAQEVGVRKVIGASRGMLTGQFLTEAFLYTSIAFVLAIVIARLALPQFTMLTGKELELNLLTDSSLLMLMVGILLLTSFVAGSYPALYLSSFSPVKIFRGTTNERLSAKQVRKALVVVQFIVSIALIQGVLVIQQQMDYLQKKKLGFSTEAKLVVPLNTSVSGEKYPLFKDAFLKNSDVYKVGSTTAAPGMPNIEDMLVFAEGQSAETSFHTMRNWVDPDYLPLMDFELLKGRFFDETRLADTVASVVINERLVQNLGYDLDEAIGKRVYWQWGETLNSHEIIGVIKDFHAGTLRQEVDNHMFQWNPNRSGSQLVASINTSDLSGLVASLNEDWTKINPGEPFEYFFLNDKLQQAYLADQRLAGLIFSFTLLAIFISCLGLFGLAAFAAESRTKEIGVRKILGASTTNIIQLMSREFLILVGLALVIATPLAFYFINQWLQGFHYHIDMPWWAFLIAGIAAIGIAFATVSFHSLKVAMSNPAESLKSE